MSTVRGTRRDDVGLGALVRATFPPASITGAPKPRVMQAIEDLEPVARGVYCGTTGWIDADRDRADLAVAIRTFACTDDGTTFGVGAGITIDSDPTAEWERDRAQGRRACWRLAGARTDRPLATDGLAMTSLRICVDGRLGAADELRISPLDHGLLVGDGVFETLRVYGGVPFAWTRHLQRLARSAAGLGLEIPEVATLREQADAVLAANDLTEARLAHHHHRRPGAARLRARRGRRRRSSSRRARSRRGRRPPTSSRSPGRATSGARPPG